MSRTLKDAPHAVRARRHGTVAPDHAGPCRVPTARLSRVTAVFYAHELPALHAFVTLATDAGYDVVTREREAYLAPTSLLDVTPALSLPRELRAAAAQVSPYVHRTLVDDAPRRRATSRDMFDEADTVPGRAKLNIFTEVTVEKLVVSQETPCCPRDTAYDLGPGDRVKPSRRDQRARFSGRAQRKARS
ncbi:hypothetical protein ACXR2T_07680 [Leucobacter sp. HY1910]